MVKQVNAAHILVKTEKEAKELKEEITKGKSFADVAKKRSQCPSGKNGGDLGWFGKGQMVAPFETAAFNAQKGDIVGPVRTDFGWHLILVKDQK
ncbi:MAG: peptidyl-prolyl cis-trans isomerase [Candidatus Methanoplasma sp.]|jgi:peptidyl-prolyl cis-trans isomerase C|nr:peptidyl-prolyl cis-trans isomerase [Candidatus Methanoplasma sp.]